MRNTENRIRLNVCDFGLSAENRIAAFHFSVACGCYYTLKMRSFFKKLLVLFITLFLVSAVTFCAFRIIPGDPALLMLGTEASDEQLMRLREDLGLDKSLGAQYTQWISGIFRGDFGQSIRYKKSVASLIKPRALVTLSLGGLSLLAISAAGIFLGIFSAKKDERPVLNFLTTLALSVPNFYLSVIIIWIFGLTLHLFVPGQFVPFSENPIAFFKSLFFPVLTIALPESAILAKYVRAAVLGEKRLGYVRTARSKGAKENAVFFNHILKNAIVAVFPLLGMIAGSVFSGSIIVEQIFGIPGIGRLLISAVSSRDFPLTQALVLYIAVIVVTINFAVDVIVQFIDPRIRLEK